MMRTLLVALGRRRKRQLALLTLLALVNAAVDMAMVAAAMLFLAALAGQPLDALPAPLGRWADAVSANRLSMAIMLFAGSAVVANAIRLLHLRLSESFICQIAHELTVEVQRRVLAQPYSYHVLHPSSELIASLEVVPTLANGLIHQWLQTVAVLASGLTIAWLLIAIDPVPALLALAGLVATYLAVAAMSSRRLNANSSILGRAYESRIAKAQESLGAIRDVKIDHRERAQLDDFRAADVRYQAASASVSFIAAAPRYVVEAAAVLTIAALAALLGTGGSGLVLIAGIAVGGMRLLPLLQQAYRSWALMAANRALLGQLAALLSLPVPRDKEGDVAPLPFRSSLRLNRVSFAFPGRPQPVLDDLSLTIERGGRIGISGETGAGKTTLVDIILGLLRPQSGTVEIDGVALDDDRIRAWQRNIAHVSQAIFVADTSIARNIAFSTADPVPDMERVQRAAESAGIADFVNSLPHGFDTPVGERGVRLSGGQRQRIAIARALYKDAALLVLDEATSELDEQTETRILANIFADKDRTIIIIAHRPSALQWCDRILCVSDGRITP